MGEVWLMTVSHILNPSILGNSFLSAAQVQTFLRKYLNFTLFILLNYTVSKHKFDTVLITNFSSFSYEQSQLSAFSDSEDMSHWCASIFRPRGGVLFGHLLHLWCPAHGDKKYPVSNVLQSYICVGRWIVHYSNTHWWMMAWMSLSLKWGAQIQMQWKTYHSILPLWGAEQSDLLVQYHPRHGNILL